MSATIKDVARETNLSISTISKYMNGGSVRKKNKQLIDEAVKKLNYHPNDLARGLRTSKTYRVGIIMGPIDTPHTARILDTIERKLKSQGYLMIFGSYENDIKRSKNIIDYMVRNGVDGIIATMHSSCHYLEKAEEMGIPVVILEEGEKGKKIDCVQTDSVNGAYSAVEHLIQEGHSRIAIIEGDKIRETSLERTRGYIRALEDYELAPDAKYRIKGDYHHKSGYEGIKKLWELDEKPTAVFVSNYGMSIGAMEAVYDLGISIPEELSIVVFDDLELSRLTVPCLTSVEQDLKQLAEKSCELLLKRMNGDYSDFPKKIRLKTKLNCRDSVKNMR